MIGMFAIFLRSAALLVPRERRPDWLAEWRAELWYVLQQSNERQALRFCLGAFRDALWLRHNPCGGVARARNAIGSPLACLLLLGAMAATAVLFFLRAGGPFETLRGAGKAAPELVFVHVFPIAVAFLVLFATSALSLGEYPASRTSRAHARRFRRRTFLAMKFLLMAPLVFCGTFDVGAILSASGVQPHAAIVGYIIGFRWILSDQRRRCPVCLRLLSESASIGEFSHNFLEWYGTELFCAKGHGLLHVPAIATTYSTQQWLDLDGSWSVLFS